MHGATRDFVIPLKSHASAGTLYNCFKVPGYFGRFIGARVTVGTLPSGGSGAGLTARVSIGTTPASPDDYLTEATAIAAEDTPQTLDPSPLDDTQNVDEDTQVNIQTTSVGSSPASANGFAVLSFGPPEMA